MENKVNKMTQKTTGIDQRPPWRSANAKEPRVAYQPNSAKSIRPPPKKPSSVGVPSPQSPPLRSVQWGPDGRRIRQPPSPSPGPCREKPAGRDVLNTTGDPSPGPCREKPAGRDVLNTTDGPTPGKTWTFEVSSEVGRKVGGISTVLNTKASATVDELGDQYVVIGITGGPDEELLESDFESPELAAAVQKMRDMGHSVRTGRWNVPGKPLAVLLDTHSTRSTILPRYRWELERDEGIVIPENDDDGSDAIVFGYLTAEFLAQFRATLDAESAMVAHFHEWTSVVGLVFIRQWQVPYMASVFTTHATLLGRYLSADGVHVAREMDNIGNPDKEAEKRGILHRHLLEKKGAQLADIFTTVSTITGQEAKCFLGRQPDLVTANGLLFHQPLDDDERTRNRRSIDDFIDGHFYDQKMKEPLVFVSAGRYEFKNKGVDIAIDALAKLNRRLQQTDQFAVVFLIYPARTYAVNYRTLRRKEDVRQFDLAMKPAMGDSFRPGQLRHFYTNGPAEELGRMSQSVLVKMKEALYYTRPFGDPPVTTHDMTDDESDPILDQLRHLHLVNGKRDRVKIVFYPRFLSKDGPLLKMSYLDLIRGADLGVFPSKYEPFGYTPAECLKEGTPAVTSDVSGFAQFMANSGKLTDPKNDGLYIVDRSSRDDDGLAIQQLTDHLEAFTQMSKGEREEQRVRARRLAADLLDWKNLASAYSEARRQALARAADNS